MVRKGDRIGGEGGRLVGDEPVIATWVKVLRKQCFHLSDHLLCNPRKCHVIQVLPMSNFIIQCGAHIQPTPLGSAKLFLKTTWSARPGNWSPRPEIWGSCGLWLKVELIFAEKENQSSPQHRHEGSSPSLAEKNFRRRRNSEIKYFHLAEFT